MKHQAVSEQDKNDYLLKYVFIQIRVFLLKINKIIFFCKLPLYDGI